ncbi:MAG TPA: glucose-6-phosphate dehydrogenase [Candidatus Limnocylindrales bacterium]|nr:glucose-6-phosphate dehydrogenase [Candidatus Limnocylindrales bacterium]
MSFADPTSLTQEMLGEPGEPCAMAIFGAGGDLTKRKLMPALYNLAAGKLLPEKFAIIGISREDLSTDQFRQAATQDIKDFSTMPVDAARWDWFVKRLYYMKGDFNDPNAYKKLADLLAQVDREQATEGNRLYYLATSPAFFAVVVKQLGAAGLANSEEGGWKRVVIEKPFGQDLASAMALNREVAQVLQENQIFRIDHYLGKETVQNILAFRFANGIFEPVWNRRYVDHMQITVAEELGVELRGDYYDRAGALRDMIPNHIFQLITLSTMEPPISFEASAVHDEQTKILHAIQPLNPEQVITHAVRGQYGDGAIDGKPVPAYRHEPRVAPDSSTETFVAMALSIDNWRWAGVPIYLRTGKRLAGRVTEVVIRFRKPPFVLFRKTSVARIPSNELVLNIQPNEGISLSFEAKIPGPTVRLGAVDMDFEYADYFGSIPSTGYETLLYDCMMGDPTLFQRADMVEAGWAVVQPILDVWKALPPREFPNYPAGSWGPQAAFDLLKRDGREWRDPLRKRGAARNPSPPSGAGQTTAAAKG